LRLDKLLANMGVGSRKEVKALLKKKQVTLNGEAVKDGSTHLNPWKDTVMVKGEEVHYQEYTYLMMNKPSGVISATTDNKDKTVIDLLASDFHIFDPFPVGRLDKDTEGLLLITNDGQLAHQLTSPKKEIVKVYFAKIEGEVTEEDISQFQKGIILDDGYEAKSADLKILSAGSISEIEVAVTEGKFHQIKRMFAAVDKKVSYLKRLCMGELTLDTALRPGEYRELTDEEREYCLQLKDQNK